MINLMNFTELRNWRNLTKPERERLKLVYGERSPAITKTLHDTNEDSLKKAKQYEKHN